MFFLNRKLMLACINLPLKIGIPQQLPYPIPPTLPTHPSISTPGQICMRRINPPHTLRPLHWLQIRQIHRHRLTITPHEDTLQLLVRQRVDLLVRHPRRHEDEIARASFGRELELSAPAHAGSAFEYVDHGLEVSVVVRAGFGIGVDDDGAGPELLGADAGEVYGGCAGHAWGFLLVV